MTEPPDLQARIDTAIRFAVDFGWVDGAHHKMWVIDQMVRALTGCPLKDGHHDRSLEYDTVIAGHGAWDTGVSP